MQQCSDNFLFNPCAAMVNVFLIFKLKKIIFDVEWNFYQTKIRSRNFYQFKSMKFFLFNQCVAMVNVFLIFKIKKPFLRCKTFKVYLRISQNVRIKSFYALKTFLRFKNSKYVNFIHPWL